MPTNPNRPVDGARPARIVIIDDHEISRAACRALLRTEGLDVVADLGVGQRGTWTPGAVALGEVLRSW